MTFMHVVWSVVIKMKPSSADVVKHLVCLINKAMSRPALSGVAWGCNWDCLGCSDLLAAGDKPPMVTTVHLHFCEPALSLGEPTLLSLGENG